MLSITVPAGELTINLDDEVRFIDTKEQNLLLEHSLISLSKWEQKWHKAFLGREKKSDQEMIDYIRCMTITQNVDDNVYKVIPPDIMKQIADYIQNPRSATKLRKGPKKPSREVITAEIIYSSMIKLGIPFECQKWHLNTLLTLIEVCNIHSTPPKKRSRKEILAENRALNEARRAKYNTTG